MDYQHPQIQAVAAQLKAAERLKKEGSAILRSPELRALYAEIPKLPAEERGAFGQEVNQLRSDLEALVAEQSDEQEDLQPIDVTAPFDDNTPSDKRPRLLSSSLGSRNPLMTELDRILGVLYGMGFTVMESRQVDDDYHMFESLNFPKDHPARDDYDTFMTTEGLIAPAHTSSMQQRALKKYRSNLDHGHPIQVAMPGRVFRNEDLDPRHEHTFYQLEGIYVDKGINIGNLLATLKAFLETYYNQELDIKVQPFYFPFTEPSLEFALSCPFCQKAGCQICSYSGWIELLGCGLIQPSVLRGADIDPEQYTGFAWGGGVDRLVMMKQDIEDIRYFHSGRLEFLRQFS